MSQSSESADRTVNHQLLVASLSSASGAAYLNTFELISAVIVISAIAAGQLRLTTGIMSEVLMVAGLFLGRLALVWLGAIAPAGLRPTISTLEFLPAMLLPRFGAVDPCAIPMIISALRLRLACRRSAYALIAGVVFIFLRQAFFVDNWSTFVSVGSFVLSSFVLCVPLILSIWLLSAVRISPLALRESAAHLAERLQPEARLDSLLAKLGHITKRLDEARLNADCAALASDCLGLAATITSRLTERFRSRADGAALGDQTDFPQQNMPASIGSADVLSVPTEPAADESTPRPAPTPPAPRTPAPRTPTPTPPSPAPRTPTPRSPSPTPDPKRAPTDIRRKIYMLDLRACLFFIGFYLCHIVILFGGFSVALLWRLVVLLLIPISTYLTMSNVPAGKPYIGLAARIGLIAIFSAGAFDSFNGDVLLYLTAGLLFFLVSSEHGVMLLVVVVIAALIPRGTDELLHAIIKGYFSPDKLSWLYDWNGHGNSAAISALIGGLGYAFAQLNKSNLTSLAAEEKPGSADSYARLSDELDEAATLLEAGRFSQMKEKLQQACEQLNADLHKDVPDPQFDKGQGQAG